MEECHRPAAILDRKKNRIILLGVLDYFGYLIVGLGGIKEREEEESWITCVECLRAPSDWCSRLGAEQVAVVDPLAGGEEVHARMDSSATLTSSVQQGQAPVLQDYVTTTAATNSTKFPSSVAVPPFLSPPGESPLVLCLPPLLLAIASLTNMAAGKCFIALPGSPPHQRHLHTEVFTPTRRRGSPPRCRHRRRRRRSSS